MMRAAQAAGGALCAALLLGVSGAAAAPPKAHPAARPAAPVQIIVIEQMGFKPAKVTVKPGQTIEWVNKDMFEHTATAKGYSFDLDLKPGAKARITAPKSGVIAYFCRFHPGMTGEIRVQP